MLPAFAADTARAMSDSPDETALREPPAGGSPAPSPPPRPPRREGLDRDSLLIVAIQGMHSHACEAKIVRSLNAVEGVRETEVDFPSGQASVIYDARRTTAHQLLDAVGEAGYRVGEYFLGRG